MSEKRYVDILDVTHRLSILPHAGFRNAPDVWCEEALVYLADDTWDGHTTTTISLRRSSIWRDAPLATFECWEGTLPNLSTQIIQAKKVGDSSPCMIAGLYRMVDDVPVWHIVSKRGLASGELQGFIYHEGDWLKDVRESLSFVAAVDHAIQSLYAAICDSMPDWKVLQGQACACPPEEHEPSYIARMKYLRDVWDHYSMLRKAVMSYVWGGDVGDFSEAVGRADELAALAACFAGEVHDRALDLKRFLSRELL